MQIVIDIPEDVLKRTVFYREFVELNDCITTIKAFEKAIILPKHHGRLIDADAFIAMMKDASKRQKYKELLIDDNLTVDDVLEAVIGSLQNEGIAEGDSPTIIEAEREEYIEQLIKKDTPLPVYLEGDGYWNGELVYDTAICQNCNAEYEVDYYHYKFCPNCGQRLDWSDVEE